MYPSLAKRRRQCVPIDFEQPTSLAMSRSDPAGVRARAAWIRWARWCRPLSRLCNPGMSHVGLSTPDRLIGHPDPSFPGGSLSHAGPSNLSSIPLNTCETDTRLHGEFHDKQPGHLTEISSLKIGPSETGIFYVRLTEDRTR